MTGLGLRLIGWLGISSGEWIVDSGIWGVWVSIAGSETSIGESSILKVGGGNKEPAESGRELVGLLR